MSGNQTFWSQESVGSGSQPGNGMTSNIVSAPHLHNNNNNGGFLTVQTDAGGYTAQQQNGGFVAQNGGFVPATQHGGYVQNGGYPVVQQQNGGFLPQNAGFMPSPQNVGFPNGGGFAFEHQQPMQQHQQGSPVMMSGHHQQLQQNSPMMMSSNSGNHQSMMNVQEQRLSSSSSSPMMMNPMNGHQQQSPMMNRSQQQQSPTMLVNGSQQISGSSPLARPGTVRHRASSVSSSSNGGKQCSQCGVDVRAVAEQMETARRKLELLQEKVEVDQALLDQEKKNFKRRLQAVKLSVKKTQLDAATKERQRQLDWAELQKHTENSTQQKLQQQQQEYETKLLQTESTAAKHALEQTGAIEGLQEQILQMQTEAENAISERQAHEAVVAKLQEKMKTAAPSAEQQERIEHLERALEDKKMEMESLEMQLLELERERDASGLLRGSGGSMTVAAGSDVCCGQCQSMNRQMADAQLQIDTLQNRQSVTDQKLTQERRKYEDLRHKMDQMEETSSAEREQNDSRLRMAKDLKDLQQQLNESRIREQDNLQHRKSIELKLIQMQEENEALQEKLDETQKSNQSLHAQLLEEKEKTELALSVAAATQRAVEDSAATQVIDVLSCAQTEPLLAVEVHAASPTINDSNRKYVIEYEWHGPQWSGVYTGQLSLISNNPDGDGTLRVDDGAVYNGEWLDGKPHGAGVWATIEGDLYCSAAWRNGEKHGRTVDVLCDGCVYRGDYEQGKRHGRGVLTWPYGAHYTGQFVEDKRNGEGVYCYADGRCYTGTYRDDRPHGYGVMKAADGAILYDGMWQLGEFIGKRLDHN